MGSLIRRISAISGAAYGVNIFEVSPPKAVQGNSSRVVGIVGDFPWGPVNVLTDISDSGTLFSTFCPAPFGAEDDYAAMDAFLNKTFPGGVKVCRIAPTSVAAATASKAYLGAAAADSTTVTAKYPGLLGNSISVAWSVNADDATARDATVSIGTAYSVLYANVATIVAAALVVTDPGDPYVTFTKTVGATVVPAAAAAVALATGVDGTAVAADYVGTGASDVGIRKFYGASVDVAVLMVASCPTAIVDAANTGLKAYCTDNDKGMAVLCTVAGQSAATAQTYKASYVDDRLVYAWPHVKTTNGYDPDLAEITVDGNSFAAALLVSVDPWISPGGAEGAQYLTGITGLETESTSDTVYEALRGKGIAAWFMATALGGAIMRGGVVTSLTSGLTKIRRRRTADYLEESIAALLELYAEKPLDLTLSSQTLGAITGAEIGAIHGFLDDEKTKGHIQSFSVDPWSQNVQADIDAGEWVIAMDVKTFSDQDVIVLKANIGDTVSVSSS